jgi:hypothetical protein
MPLCEIEERFVKSELAIIGWRSQETAHQMSANMKKSKEDSGDPSGAQNDGTVPIGLPERFFNSDGEVDLRQVTGADALNFLRKQGVNVPFIPYSEQKKE